MLSIWGWHTVPGGSISKLAEIWRKTGDLCLERVGALFILQPSWEAAGPRGRGHAVLTPAGFSSLPQSGDSRRPSERHTAYLLLVTWLSVYA